VLNAALDLFVEKALPPPGWKVAACRRVQRHAVSLLSSKDEAVQTVKHFRSSGRWQATLKLEVTRHAVYCMNGWWERVGATKAWAY
jgi:hypothetical protein